MSPMPGRTDQTGLRSAADRATEQAAHSAAQTSAKPASDGASTDEQGTAISADDHTNDDETQKTSAEVASGAGCDPTAESSPSADSGGRRRPSTDVGQEEAENGRSDRRDTADSASSVSAEDGRVTAPPPPEQGQNGTNGPTSPARPNEAEEPAPPAADSKRQIHDTSHSAETSEKTEDGETLQSSNREPPNVETVDLAPVPTNGRDLAEPAKGSSVETTSDLEELKLMDNLKLADNRESLEPAPDQASAVSVAPAAEVAVEGADSRPSSVEPSVQVSDGAVPAAAGSQPELFGPSPDAEAGPAAPATTSGMTETRSIWVVGSEEHLPGAVGGEEGGAAAASWATVHSTVRAIRVFRRGVSKRLRRPASHDRQHEPPAPGASRSADRQLSQSAAAEPQHEPASGGFLRSLSFRRSASWRGRHARDHHQGGGGDALGSAMLQTAAPVPLQPHVNRTAFGEACAAYEPVQKPGGLAADLASREKKESQLKEELRTSYYPLDHPSRHQLWSHICQMHGAALGQNEEYESTVRQLEGAYGPALRGQHQIPPFVHSFYMNQYALSEQGVWTAERVLAVLYYNNPAITYAPSMYPICCLMLHYMDEADTYNALNMMLRNKKQGYLLQTKRDFEISWKILIKLCRKHTKTSLHFLQQEARAGENVEHVLADWLAWLFCFLPFAHAVRLMDCYLMEGEKVLYRGAMAVVLLVHKMVNHQLGEWTYSFKEFTVQEVIEKFCTNMQLAPEKLLKTMFGIRGFSRESLTASYARVKAQIKAGGGRLNFPERRCTRSVSKQQSHPGGMGMPSVMSQDELAQASSTIGVKELLRLWENLPARYALYTPLLIYTSDEHGFSLKTFYQKVATFEPTVLLLRTTEGAVFGAYCSVTWNCRNQSQEDGSRQRYFGTGETFLFTLRPRLTVYPWVGKVRQAGDPELAGLSHSEQLFMAADNTMVTIGGGGGQAIWLDENLSCGKTDACETFANPPLTSSGSFDVACMEAFAFSPA